MSIAFVNCTEHLDGIENARAYLFPTVTNTAASQQRSTRRRQIRDLHALLPEHDPVATGDLDVRRAVAASLHPTGPWTARTHIDRTVT